MSNAKKGDKNPKFWLGKQRPVGAGKPSLFDKKISVLYIDNNETKTYDSIHEAARALNINKSVIDMYFSRNQVKPYKGKYIFNKIDY
jgi:hypothetical protein